MTANTIRNHPCQVKALKKQSSVCHPLSAAKQHRFSRKLPMTLRTKLSNLASPGTLHLDTVRVDNCSTVNRKSTNILESLRRRYVHRGLGQTIVSSNGTREQRDIQIPFWNGVSTQTPSGTSRKATEVEDDADVIILSSDDSHACSRLTNSQGSSLEVDGIEYTSPLRIRSARRSVAPLKFDYSTLQTDISDESYDIDDDGDDSISLNSSFSYVSGIKTNLQQRQQSIRFHSYVKVVEIPHRNTYSDKQKRRMWNGCDTIRRNAKRNRIEYEYEGREWHCVVEEAEFGMVNGRMVHPVHIIPFA
jgi:hypothetical protein